MHIDSGHHEGTLRDVRYHLVGAAELVYDLGLYSKIDRELACDYLVNAWVCLQQAVERGLFHDAEASTLASVLLIDIEFAAGRLGRIAVRRHLGDGFQSLLSSIGLAVLRLLVWQGALWAIYDGELHA